MRRASLVFALGAALQVAPANALTAYVSNERDNSVSVVDLDKLQTVSTIDVGQRPRGITVTADGRDILVCASDDDTVQIIDRKTLQIVGTLALRPPIRKPSRWGRRAIRSMCRTRTTTW